MQLLYPKLSSVRFLNQSIAGEMIPKGITIHYTADRNLNRTAKALVDAKLAYHLLIDRNGDVIQMAEFNKRVNHAGKALWNGVSPNKNHIAISLLSWGKLNVNDAGFFAWNGQTIEKSETFFRVSGTGVSGFWDGATDNQLIALEHCIEWMIDEFDIHPDNVCGHDECAIPPGRKIDPGGVLPYTMLELRRRY